MNVELIENKQAELAVASPAPKGPALSASFYILWLGQFVSVFGTALSAFALSVWLYQRTGSVLDFTGMALAGTVPALLCTPWAGSFTDRHDKRLVMIIADTCAALAMASVGYLVWSDQFQVWHLYAAEAIASMSMAFSVPAAKASISLMVAKDQLGRAAGMFEVTEGIAALAGPLLAGMLLGAIGLSGIILLDILSFCIAVTSLFFLRLPATAKPSAPSGEGAWHVVMTALYDFRRACAYFRHYPSMARIYAQVAMADFLTGMAATFFTPLVLNAHSERSLAMISSIGAVGALLGGALMIAWGGPKRWLTWLLLLNVGEGLVLILAGSSSNFILLSACAFYIFFSTSVLGACVQAVWQRKVPLEQQGSVLSLQHSVQVSLAPIGAVLGGVLVHYMFEPLMSSSNSWQALFAPLAVSGKGAGIGLMFVCAGAVLILVSVIALFSRRIWNLERDVPDAH